MYWNDSRITDIQLSSIGQKNEFQNGHIYQARLNDQNVLDLQSNASIALNATGNNKVINLQCIGFTKWALASDEEKITAGYKESTSTTNINGEVSLDFHSTTLPIFVSSASVIDQDAYNLINNWANITSLNGQPILQAVMVLMTGKQPSGEFQSTSAGLFILFRSHIISNQATIATTTTVSALSPTNILTTLVDTTTGSAPYCVANYFPIVSNGNTFTITLDPILFYPTVTSTALTI